MFANALKMDTAALFSAMSPSKTCKVRVSSTRYRNDPYRARVAPFVKPVTPVFVGRKFFNAPAAIVPLTAAAPATQPASTATTQPPSPAKVHPAKVAPLKPAVITKATAAAAAAVTQAAAPIKKDNASKPPQMRYALVGFKHEASMFQAPFRVAPGDIVMVEADRGEHIGVVQSITTTKPKYNVPSSIVRRASRTEAASIDELTAKESKVTSSVQKLAESFGLGIKVLDTEFQFDQNKLTVFFNSKVFVDFRKLQRSLFREHRCRIWLVNWAEVRTYAPVPVTMPSA